MRSRKSYLFVVLVFHFISIANSLTAQIGSQFDSLSKQLITAEDSVTKATILISLSKTLEGDHPQEAVRYAQQALQIAEKNQYKQVLIEACIQLATSYVNTGEYEKSYKFADIAREKAVDNNQMKEVALCNSILAKVYYEIGDYEKSAQRDFENLKYYEQLNDSKKVGVTYGNIGIDFISQNYYQKGLEYLKKSLEIAIKNKDVQGMAYQYNNIAGVYSEYYKDNILALHYYQEALSINDRLNDELQKGIYLMNIGNCYDKLKQFHKVKEYYFKALAIFKNQNNLPLQAECYTLIGEFLHSQGQYPNSLKYADTAMSLSGKTNNIEQIKLSAGLLHRIYLSKNDIIHAYQYAMVENTAKDSLFVLQNKKEVYKLEFQYNFEKSDKEKQLARQRKENLFKITIVSLFFGIVIILLLFSRYRYKTKSVFLEKKTIEKELEFKNKELTINLLSLIKKNEMLADVSRKLSQLGKEAKKDETKEALTQLNRELRTSTDDKMMKEFSLRFQEVHSGFYESLLGKFPDLTQNELKLCAFLRLNMSTKDISELTGQRGLTIDHARYRLRKKLGISNSEVNLVAFLSQI